MEEVHEQKVTQMIKSAEKILKKEEEDARLLDRCEATRKEWAKGLAVW